MSEKQEEKQEKKSKGVSYPEAIAQVMAENKGKKLFIYKTHDVKFVKDLGNKYKKGETHAIPELKLEALRKTGHVK